VRGTALDAATLRDAAVVVLWDVLPGQSSAAALTRFAEQGGGVTIIAGRRLAGSQSGSSSGSSGGSSPVPETSGSAGGSTASTASGASAAPRDRGALLPARITGLADRLADRGGTLTGVRFEHPLFAPFRDAQDALLMARFLRYPRMDATAGSDILARFDDGLPAIIERRAGAGRVLLLATALDGAGSDFPLQPAVLPVRRQLVLHTAGRDATPLWRSTADNWSLPETVADPVVRAPDESLLRPKQDSAGGAVPLADAGHYSVFSGTASGEPRGTVAVNTPVTESDLTPIDPKELLLGVRTSENLAAADSAVPTPDALERRQNAWRFLLVFVALALLGVRLLATRGWRAVARRYPPAVPDRSQT
jgi:hypothetical protein